MKNLFITFLLLLSLFFEGFSQVCPVPNPCTQNNIANHIFVNGDVICITTDGFNLGSMSVNLGAGETATLYIAAGITVNITAFNTATANGATFSIINEGTWNQLSTNFQIKARATFNNCATGTLNGDNITVNGDGALNNLGIVNTTGNFKTNSSGEVYNQGVFNIDGNFTNNGTICGPNTGCGSFAVDGTSRNNGSGNFGVDDGGSDCGNLDICSGGEGGFDNENGDVGSDTTHCHPNAATGCPPTILPVELINFQSETKPDYVLINWQTASETDNDYFLIEKSRDGKTFQSIGRVNGNGTSSDVQKYEFIDDEAKGGTNYYRLNQVDYDGTSNISKVIVNYFTMDSDLKLNVFPNPSNGQAIYLKLQNLRKQTKVTVMIYTSRGRKVVEKEILFNHAEVEIQKKLVQGSYFVVLIGEGFNLKKRLMVN